MKRSLSLLPSRPTALVVAGTGLIASTYGLVRLAYGLFLPDVRDSLGIGAGTAGLVAAAASLAYCAGALAGLTWPARSRSLVLGALLTASLGSWAVAAAPGPGVFAVAAVVSSVGAGLASPGLVTMVERNVAAAWRDRAQATVNSGTGPGLVGAGLLALLVLPDWRLGFAVGGLAAALTGVAVLVLDRAAPGPPGRRTANGGRAWVRLLVRPGVGALLLGTASAAVWTYGRSHVVDAGASPTVATWAWIALGVGGTATALTAGRLARMAPPLGWTLTVLTVAGSVALLGPAAASPVPAVLACAVFGWGFVAATSVLISWTAELAPDHAAPGTALLFVTLVLGQAIGSVLAGAVAGLLGMTAAFLVAAGVAIAAAACGSLTTKGRPR